MFSFLSVPARIAGKYLLKLSTTVIRREYSVYLGTYVKQKLLPAPLEITEVQRHIRVYLTTSHKSSLIIVVIT